MKTILFAVLIALSGCSGNDGSNASGEMRDCRNAGLECGAGFECRENAEGVFECASAMTPSGGVSAPNAAPSGGVNRAPVGGMNAGGSPTNMVAGVPAGGGSPTSMAGGAGRWWQSTSMAGGVPGGGELPWRVVKHQPETQMQGFKLISERRIPRRTARWPSAGSSTSTCRPLSHGKWSSSSRRRWQ